MPGFLEEFKRRNVFRVAMAYAVFTWLILQVADTAAPLLGLPDWVSSFILLLLGLLLIPSLVFAWAFELTTDGIKRQTEVDRDQSITATTGKKLNYATIAALLLVLVIVATDRYRFPQSSTPEHVGVVTEAGEVSIAVLPFADMSPNHDQDYFSDGISEEILNGLARLQTMKVAGRTSSFAFKGRNEDLREIGMALGVQHVVEGSVRKDGDKLRITAQLISVSDGFHLWSETYDRELTDVFAVQDEISAAIVRELQGSLLGDATVNSEADDIAVADYERYLAARKLITMRTNEGLTEARAILEEVVERAPDYAPGISSLAESLILLRGGDFNSYGNLDLAAVSEMAKPLLDRAIELDPNLSDAYAVRGLLADEEDRDDESEADLLRAVELNPSSSKAWVWLSNLEGKRLRPDARRRYLMEAVAIDPLWLVPNINLVYIDLDFGRIDEVWTIIERLRPFHQDSALFHDLDGRASSSGGQLANAHRALLKAYEMSPDTPQFASQYAFNLIALQDFEQALAVMPPQITLAPNFLTGEWDAVLPEVREILDEDQSVPFMLFGYVIGSSYIGDYECLVDFYDTHMKSPEWFTARQQSSLMTNFAIALRELGRDADAQILLNAYREDLLAGDARGLNNPFHDQRWSIYYALSGDDDAAIAKLRAATDAGLVTAIWQYSPEYHGLEQGSGFLEIKAKNLVAVNTQRAELGWAPVAEVGIFYEPNSD